MTWYRCPHRVLWINKAVARQSFGKWERRHKCMYISVKSRERNNCLCRYGWCSEFHYYTTSIRAADATQVCVMQLSVPPTSRYLSARLSESYGRQNWLTFNALFCLTNKAIYRRNRAGLSHLSLSGVVISALKQIRTRFHSDVHSKRQREDFPCELLLDKADGTVRCHQNGNLMKRAQIKEPVPFYFFFFFCIKRNKRELACKHSAVWRIQVLLANRKLFDCQTHSFVYTAKSF